MQTSTEADVTTHADIGGYPVLKFPIVAFPTVTVGFSIVVNSFAVLNKEKKTNSLIHIQNALKSLISCSQRLPLPKILEISSTTLSNRADRQTFQQSLRQKHTSLAEAAYMYSKQNTVQNALMRLSYTE